MSRLRTTTTTTTQPRTTSSFCARDDWTAVEPATPPIRGVVYSALGDQQQALDYFNQALPLQRQVGDKAGEAATRFNIAMAAATLGDLDCAVAELEQVVALDEAIHHPDLESDRAALARMRARRKPKQFFMRWFGR